MPVINLAPGAIYEFGPNQIEGICYVYRTGDGYPDPGRVGWAADDDGVLHDLPIAVGETVNFAIDGRAGMLGNAAPSRVQLLYTNETATEIAAGDRRAFDRLFNRDKRVQPDGGDDTQDVMNRLNAQWYNAVVTGCGLSPATFQLVQGNSPLGNTTESLWNLFDAVPPRSVDNFYNPSQSNVLSTNYGAVINNLIAQNTNKFQHDMGDYYAPWCDYLRTKPPIPAGGYLKLFDDWATYNMPPDQAQTCHTDYQQITKGAVPVAVQMWDDACNVNRGIKAYNATIAQLQDKLLKAPLKKFTLNSNETSSDISNAWAKAEASVAFDLFKIGGSGNYKQLSETLVDDGLEIAVTFDRLLTFTAGPLARASTDPTLEKFPPWFHSAALNLAHKHDDNTVWNNTPPDWDDTFGPNGNLQRSASGIVVVDGISITTKSLHKVSKKDHTAVEAAVKTGFWPFFQASGSGGWSHDASFSSSDMMTVQSSCKLGNPQILGVIVYDINTLLLTA